MNTSKATTPIFLSRKSKLQQRLKRKGENKKMKDLILCKVYSVGIIAISFLLTVSALSVGARQQNPVSITFWHVWGGPRVPLMEKQIADFEAKHPNIKIEALLMSQTGMGPKYLTAIAGGMPPDVLMVHGSRNFATFAEKKVLVPLDNYLMRDGMEGEKIWYESDWKTYLYKGKTYGLPLAAGGGYYLFFYDKDDFREVGLNTEKPPITWQELEKYAARLTVKKNGKLKRIGYDVNGFVMFPFKEWLFLNNGNLISDDGKTILFGSPEGLETLKWMVGFTDRLYGGYELLLPFTDKMTDNGRIQRGGWFAGDKIAMHTDGVWHFLMQAASAPDKNVGAALMPYNDLNPKAKVRNILEGGWCYAIPVGAKHPDEAWEWVKYTCAEEGNLNFFKGQLRPSPVRKFNEDPYFAEHNPFWSVVQESLKKSDFSITLPVQAEIDEIIIQMTDEAVLHKKTPEKALKWAVERCQKIVDEYWATR